MNAGSLNTLVQIQQQSSVPDELGQPVLTWSTVCTCWADARHLSGIEAAKAGTDASTVKASIRIRFRTGITSSMRVIVGGVVYQIKAVMPDLRQRVFVDLVCEQVAG